MAVKIRLRKQGRKNRPFFRIVVANDRTKRDGKYLDSIGYYDPMEKDKEKRISVDVERIRHWLSQGAILTERMENIVSVKCPELLKK